MIPLHSFEKIDACQCHDFDTDFQPVRIQLTTLDVFIILLSKLSKHPFRWNIYMFECLFIPTALVGFMSFCICFYSVSHSDNIGRSYDQFLTPDRVSFPQKFKLPVIYLRI